MEDITFKTQRAGRNDLIVTPMIAGVACAPYRVNCAALEPSKRDWCKQRPTQLWANAHSAGGAGVDLLVA